MAEITHIESRRTASAPAAARRSDLVRCVYIPLREGALLLPNTAVAEVIGAMAPEPLAGAPAWLMGRLTWRERRIPLVSFEAASGGEPAPPNRDSRIVVLNTLNGNQRMPYIGILSQAIPQLRLASERNLVGDSEVSVHEQSVASYVKVDGESAIVPDLDDIERRLVQLQHG
ncbi:MAG: chemotaxis protein CheW [Pseudomonadota bacterium]|nr:MAG: chemotaxis protein CheW [Pseudomonadota bacterium]